MVKKVINQLKNNIMKNLKLTVLGLLLTTSGAFAQNANPEISDMWSTREVIIMEAEDSDDEVKQVELTSVYTPVKLDPKDQYKLNQDIIYMPTQVSKTIMLDYDVDDSFDKKVEFTYEKSDNYDLDFTLTKDGIIILTDKEDLFVKNMWNKNTKVKFSNVRNNRIKIQGDYVVELTDGQKIDLKIANYESM
jgi:hypothetical protein